MKKSTSIALVILVVFILIGVLVSFKDNEKFPVLLYFFGSGVVAFLIFLVVRLHFKNQARMVEALNEILKQLKNNR